MKNRQDKGFTLVELLIVIVILGILATITVFAVRGITDQGQTSACDADKKTMQTAAEAYFAQEGGTAIPITPAGAVDGVTGVDAEGTLVEVGLLVSESSNMDVSTAGVVTGTPGGECPEPVVTTVG